VQIIFVDRGMARARTFTLTPRLITTVLFGTVLAISLAVVGLYALTFRFATELRLPFVHDFVSLIVQDELNRKEQFMKDNVAAMARKLGEMQAQLMRLDALGERVSKIAGVRPEEFNFRELPGRGGAIEGTGRQMSMEELRSEVKRIADGVEQRSDYMNVVESELMAARVRRALLPQDAPISTGFVGSGFGMRTDPFTGQYAMHAGIDFAAPSGTPIYAAAGGVVSAAEMHPSYGNCVTIDHGNDLSTLYGHASKLFVKPGDIVKRGQKIAEVGSTGRSTGSHLHFETHVKGVPQNPWNFLAAQKPGSPLASVIAQGRDGGRVDAASLAAATHAR
jgi:murein DD-endopeptidase MepM/ murein hydrolase activator NlpD